MVGHAPFGKGQDQDWEGETTRIGAPIVPVNLDLIVLIDEGTFLNAFFPAVPTDTTTPIGAAENAGDIRTKDISTFLFPNAYLYQGNPTNCCVLGFHTYDIEPGSASNGWRERRYVLNYASWITAGLFGGDSRTSRR
jgi:hypothetical protein